MKYDREDEQIHEEINMQMVGRKVSLNWIIKRCSHTRPGGTWLMDRRGCAIKILLTHPFISTRAYSQTLQYD